MHRRPSPAQSAACGTMTGRRNRRASAQSGEKSHFDCSPALRTTRCGEEAKARRSARQYESLQDRPLLEAKLRLAKRHRGIEARDSRNAASRRGCAEGVRTVGSRMADLVAAPDIAIPESELEERFVLSSGPGGQ